MSASVSQYIGPGSFLRPIGVAICSCPRMSLTLSIRAKFRMRYFDAASCCGEYNCQGLPFWSNPTSILRTTCPNAVTYAPFFSVSGPQFECSTPIEYLFIPTSACGPVPQEEAPACQATLSNDNNCVTSPSLDTDKCQDTCVVGAR